MTVVNTLVEGETDQAAASKIITGVGLSVGRHFGRKGSGYIKQKIGNFNNASAHASYLVLIDLMDTKAPCPSEVLSQWLPAPHKNFLVRIVVRELESWLLADAANMSSFLSVPRSRIPSRPEELPDPKRALINIARRSRRKEIREALVPEMGSTAVIGVLYVSEIKRFIHKYWDIQLARQAAPSLDRCMLRLMEMKSRLLAS